MLNYGRVIAAAAGTVWMMRDDKVEALMRVLALRATGAHVPADERQAVAAAAPKRLKSVTGGVAVLPLLGVMSQRMDLFAESSGGTSTEALGRAFDEAVRDDSIGAIVLDVDSPGGSVYGLEELSDRIYAARGTKPIVAVANSEMASSAYYVGTAAGHVYVAPGGEVGSVGTVALHLDTSEADKQAGLKYTLIRAGEFKVEENSLEPLNEAARAYIQRRVDDYYGMFVRAVARNRGTTPADVRANYGKGRMLGADDAIKAGMVDGVKTLAQVLGELAPTGRAVDLARRALHLTPHRARR